MKNLLLCLFISAGFAFMPHALPQEQRYTVGEVLRIAHQLDRDSTTVRLRGYITRKISQGLYQFEDRTAEIKVYIEDKYLPPKPIDDRVALILYARVQYEQNKPVTLMVNRPVIED